MKSEFRVVYKGFFFIISDFYMDYGIDKNNYLMVNVSIYKATHMIPVEQQITHEILYQHEVKAPLDNPSAIKRARFGMLSYIFNFSQSYMGEILSSKFNIASSEQQEMDIWNNQPYKLKADIVHKCYILDDFTAKERHIYSYEEDDSVELEKRYAEKMYQANRVYNILIGHN